MRSTELRTVPVAAALRPAPDDPVCVEEQRAQFALSERQSGLNRIERNRHRNPLRPGVSGRIPGRDGVRGRLSDGMAHEGICLRESRIDPTVSGHRHGRAIGRWSERVHPVQDLRARERVDEPAEGEAEHRLEVDLIGRLDQRDPVEGVAAALRLIGIGTR